MIEPLLDRIRDLERANRRWKAACTILSVVLLAVLLCGTTFLGIQGYRGLVENRRALAVMEEARAQEAQARAQAQAAKLQAQQALDQAQQQLKKE